MESIAFRVSVIVYVCYTFKCEKKPFVLISVRLFFWYPSEPARDKVTLQR